MKRVLVLVAALVVVGFGVWKVYTPHPDPLPQAERVGVRIGALLPLTGNFAELGENAKLAVKFAVEDAKLENINVEVIFEDDAFNPAKTAVLGNKLINVDRVKALISWSAVGGNVVSPIAGKNGIIHFGITNDQNVARGKYNFIHFTDSERYVGKLLTLLEKHNVKKLAILVAYQPGLQRTADIEEKILKGKGIETKRYNIHNETRDFNMLVDEIKAQNFDMWDVSANPPAVDLIVKTALQKGVEVPLTSMTAFSYANDKRIFEGLEYVDSPDGDVDLLNRVKNITGSENFFSVGFTYDAVRILVEAYDVLYGRLGREPLVDEVAEYMLSTGKRKGVVGEIWMDEEGVVHSNAVIKKIVNGKPVVVGE